MDVIHVDFLILAALGLKCMCNCRILCALVGLVGCVFNCVLIETSPFVLAVRSVPKRLHFHGCNCSCLRSHTTMPNEPPALTEVNKGIYRIQNL